VDILCAAGAGNYDCGFSMTTKIPMHPIAGSGSIAAYGYDPAPVDERGRRFRTGLLVLQFVDGSEYWYRAVPESVLADFLMAKSRGSFFHKYIRPAYQSARVPDDDEEVA
jgi:hypothetical protein